MATVNGVYYPVGSDTYDLPADFLEHAQTDSQQALDAAASAIAEAKWDRTSTYLTVGDNVDTLTPNGAYAVASGTVGAALGLPEGSTGTLTNIRFGTGAGTQVWITRTTSPSMYIRAELSGGWAPWIRIDDPAKRWDQTGSFVQATDDLDTMPNGVYGVPSGTVATALGLPEGLVGVLTSVRFGTGAGTQTYGTRSLNPALYIRAELSSGWTPWIRVGGGSGSFGEFAPLAPAPTAGLKTSAVALTLGYGGSQVTGSGTTVAVQYAPADTTRARLHLVNRNPRYQMADAPPVSISATAIGLHNGSGGSAAWTPLPGSGATPWTSEWVDIPSAWHGQEIAVRYAWTGSGTIQQNIGHGWTDGSQVGVLPMHAWLEVGAPAATPTVAVFGDSIASGSGSSRPVVDSWIDQYARTHGYTAAHWSHSGDSATNWPADADRKWWLYGDQIAAPDALIYAMGSNDIFSGITLEEAKARITATATLLRQRVTPNLYAATITPRNGATGSTETVRRQVNTWLSASGLFRDVFDTSAAVSDDDETIRPEYNADGTHLNTAGYAAMAAAIGQVVGLLPGASVTYVGDGVYEIG